MHVADDGRPAAPGGRLVLQPDSSVEELRRRRVCERFRAAGLGASVGGEDLDRAGESGRVRQPPSRNHPLRPGRTGRIRNRIRQGLRGLHPRPEDPYRLQPRRVRFAGGRAIDGRQVPQPERTEPLLLRSAPHAGRQSSLGGRRTQGSGGVRESVREEHRSAAHPPRHCECGPRPRRCAGRAG